MKYLYLSACTALLASCSPVLQSPDALIVFKDVQIPRSEPLVAQVAKHSYLDYRRDTSSPWYRIEVLNSRSGILHFQIDDEEANLRRRFDRRVRVLAQTSQLPTPDAIERIEAFADRYGNRRYIAWPGPNSNTFADCLVRAIPGFHVDLDHNAIGKEYVVRAGKTTAGTGVEAQTPLVGAALGLKEGVEVNAIGLSAGVRMSPPAIKVPFLPALPPRR